ncbi:MAG: response regulator [Planctomycetes bacterium]|nr:response regulator [Planctomycetota bacterium]
MALGIYLTRPARDTLLSLTDASIQRGVQGWSALAEAVVSAETPEVTLRERTDIPPPFGEPALHCLAESTGAIPGQLAFLLRTVDAATLAGLMVRAPADEIRRKRNSFALSDLELDAAREGLNQFCGGYARGLREMLSEDLSVAQTEARPVHPARGRADLDHVFRWNPWLSVQWKLSFQGFDPSSFLLLLPCDTAQALLTVAGVNAFTDKLVGRALFVSEDAKLLREVEGRFACTPLTLIGVRSLAEAYASAAREPVDLLLLDLGANTAEGLKRCQSARTHPKSANLPIVVTSHHAQKELVVQAIKAGARDFLVHPLEAASAIPRLAKLVTKA